VRPAALLAGVSSKEEENKNKTSRNVQPEYPTNRGEAARQAKAAVLPARGEKLDTDLTEMGPARIFTEQPI
jgi:hypothetical protein